MANTPDESFKELHESFNPHAAGNLNATYLFDITGENGGKWILEIKNGNCNLKKESTDNPSVTISISDKDWVEMLKGNLNSQMAFMMGKLRVSGDMTLALKLQSIFPGKA